MNTLNSPWADLPNEAPYVLPRDTEYIKYFNRHAKDAVRIQTGSFPEPYFGNPEAPVVVLLLNPGGGDGKSVGYTDLETVAALRRAYSQGAGSDHFHLANESSGAGRKWWGKTCKALLEEVGRERLAKRVLSIEFSAYHSKSFGHADLRLPSQEYSFALVRSAMQRHALIVCMRGERLWCGAIPELSNYPRLRRLKNPRSASLSPKNVAEYREIVDALQDGA